MVTAVNEARVAVQCLNKGACDYLVKTISQEDLVFSMKRTLERKRLLDILDIEKNKSRSARLLGIGLNTLQRKLKSYGVE
jgi:DNA-binding NtrC family response regulator